jgi:SAM-dependent methyltransferase
MTDHERRPPENRDERVVTGFGEEWSRFSQGELPTEERGAMFSDYFGIFPWSTLPPGARGADIGCGSGRWAVEVAPRVGHLTCVDASGAALEVARKNLGALGNVDVRQADVGALPFAQGELDFAYSLGVLHHVPDTEAALANIAKVLKPGAVFLVYLYYAFDNRPAWFRQIWRASDGVRRVISQLPKTPRFLACEAIAGSVYWPLARTAALLDRAGVLPGSFPLSYYRDKSFYVMRTDALDRFGTQLEKRYTRADIEGMLTRAGFRDVRFSDGQPYWCAVARR